MDEAKRLKRTNYIALAVVLALTLGCILGIFAVRQRHSFTREKWLEDPGHRTRIVDDLLADHELIGMSREAVLELLGAHDNEMGYFQREDRFVYWLGPERGLMSIDSEWLILGFTGDTVTDCFLTTD